jgi:membrane protein
MADQEMIEPAGEAAARAPRGPTDLSGRSWLQALKRAFQSFREDNATDWAAGLTYYAVLSVFPGIIVLFSLLGVFGSYPQTADALLDIVADLGPASAVDTLTGPIEDVTSSSGTAGALLGFGTLAAIWAASGYLGAFARASNAIYGVEEDRPFWKLRPQQVGVTVVLLVFAALIAVGLVISGPVARSIGDVIGVGSTAVDIWNIAKWPVMIVLVAVMLAILFYWAPDLEAKRFRWISPGSFFAVIIVIVASALFAFYVANFGSYSATYGSLGGIIVFLLWLWIANNGLLLGQELNAQLDRARVPEGEGE